MNTFLWAFCFPVWSGLGIILGFNALERPRTSRATLHQRDIILFLLWWVVTIAGIAGELA